MQSKDRFFGYINVFFINLADDGLKYLPESHNKKIKKYCMYMLYVLHDF